MTAPQLYPDQTEFVLSLRAAMRDHQAVLAQAATGFGKTVVSAYIAKRASERRKRVIFAVHRRNLVKQTALTFAEWGIDFGFIVAGRPFSPNPMVHVASIETMRRRLDRMPRADLLYIDEAHLACSPTWTQVIDHFRAQGAHIIGNTATPVRLDGKPLGTHFDVIVEGPEVRWLIENGRLSEYDIYAPSTPDLSDVGKRAGDYVTAQLEAVMDNATIVGDAAAHYHKLMPSRRAIAFCVSVRHAQHVAEYLTSQGIPAASVDGTMGDDERDRIVRAFADGRIHVLSNCELVTTGFDLSAQVGREVPVEGALMLRPTESLSLWLQMLGRCLRRKPHPAVILDHAGGTLRHGLPCQAREWSLDGRAKKKGTATGPGLRACPQCFAIYLVAAPACPACGHVHVVERSDLPDEKDGELVRLDLEAARKKDEESRHRRMKVGRARTINELVQVAREQGYKPSWAGVIYASRDRSVNRTEAIRAAQKVWRETAHLNPNGDHP